MTISVEDRIVRLASGRDFDVLGEVNMTIEDIAGGLATECRYAGQFSGPRAPKFYSVAQHSVIGSQLFRTRSLRQAFLLHDAEEFVLRDMLHPIKSLFPGYVELGDQLREKIFCHFGVDYSLYKVVKSVDDYLYTQERRNFWEGYGTPDFAISAIVDPTEAKAYFLKEFNLLWHQ